MIGGQVTGQLALILVVPILSRAYPPEVYGYLHLATALALTIQPVATLRVEFVLPILVNSKLYRRTLRLGWVTIAVTTFSVLVVALVLELLAAREAASVALMIATLLAGYAWLAIDNAVLIRNEQRKRLASRNALTGVLGALLQVGCAYGELPIWSLAFALLSGRLMAILLTHPKQSTHIATWTSNAGTEQQYRGKRIWYSVTSGLISSASLQSLAIVGGIGLSPSAAGYIGTAQRIAGSPVGMLGQGITQVFQSRTARIVRERQAGLFAATRTQILVLSIAGAILATVLIVTAPLLAAPILGDDWDAVGKVTAVLAAPFALQLVVNPVTPMLVMLGRERHLFLIQALRLVVTIGSTITVALTTRNMYAFCATFASTTTLFYMLIVLAALRAARRFDREIATLENRQTKHA